MQTRRQVVKIKKSFALGWLC